MRVSVHFRSERNWSIGLLLAALAAGAGLTSAAEPDTKAYLEHIKPVFKERCFACHGALKQKAELRLDTVASMQTKGILEDGELMARLSASEPDERMPPEGEPLSAEELEHIRAWIASGAPAPADEKAEDDPASHWAFQRIERPELPTGEGNLIDRYLAEQHRNMELVAQAPAERSILLRRLYLDLIGLPPTPEQLASEQPLDEIIDGLLASPHYGERWGRHWMDVWRYSDQYGLGGMLRFSQRHIWHWREWIVTSLNEDKGYGQMILEMLAGDEVAPDDLDTVAATGFLARNYYLFNRDTWLDSTVEHTGKAFLGLTMNCAKCHDHKYDPIDHEDYYRFRAIFEPHRVRLDALPGETDYNKNALPRVFDETLDAKTFVHRRGNPSEPIVDRSIPPGPPSFLAGFAEEPAPVDLPVDAWAPGARVYVQRDRIAAAEALVVKARADLKTKRSEAAAVEKAAPESVAPDAYPPERVSFVDEFERSRPERWQMIGEGWRYQGGLLAQTEVTMERSTLRTRAAHPQDFDVSLTFRTTGGAKWKSTGISFDVDKEGEQGHTVYVSAFAGGPKVQVAHQVGGRKIYPPNARRALPVKLNQEYTLRFQVRGSLLNVFLDGEFLFAYNLPNRRDTGLLELFAFDATAEFSRLELKALPKDTTLKPAKNKATPSKTDVVAAVDLAAARLAAAEAELAFVIARVDADHAALREQEGAAGIEAGRLQVLAKLAQAEVDLLSGDAGKIGKAKQAKKAAEAALAKNEFSAPPTLRGSERALDQKSHKPTQYPPTYPKTSTGRRSALARWIIHRDNPLTARVAVNHIWMRHFGEPLVESVNDFGRTAPVPRHQALLDALACELIESDFSMKHLHRLILASEAWQRGSSNLNADPATFAADPGNQHYWRANPRRMESEVIRDSLLHLSGRLDVTTGGPSIKATPAATRRSIYLLHSRDDSLRFLTTFDGADIFACYRREESIVPQQALAVMNSKLVIDSAALITKKLNPALPADEFARAAFRLVLAREPLADELAACREFLRDQPKRERFVHALLNHNDFVMIR